MRRTVMEHFVKRYEDRIKGIISGFDRILFRGILRGISYPEGLGKLMSSQGCLYKDFDGFAKHLSEQIKEYGEQIATQAGREWIYLDSPKASKEKIARQ